MTEYTKQGISAAFGDVVDVGRTEDADRNQLAFISRVDENGTEYIYFDKPGPLDDVIEGLMKARRDAFGTKP